MSEHIVAIHQPNFFPWLGYFNKILRCDTFIFLDHVQFPKKGGTWSNRVKVLDDGEARWLTAPVKRNYHGVRTYQEMRFSDDNNWRLKILDTLKKNYKDAPSFSEEFKHISEIILNEENNLANFNKNAVCMLARRIDIETQKFFCSSQLAPTGSSNEMLISLTKSVGGTAYMCGGGADGYQLPEAFEAAGISLLYQNFEHPIYPQIQGEWTGGLSILDALFNIGASGVRKILKPT